MLSRTHKNLIFITLKDFFGTKHLGLGVEVFACAHCVLCVCVGGFFFLKFFGILNFHGS